MPGYPQGDSNNPHESLEKQPIPDPSGTDSGTPSDAVDLDALAAALQSLSPADRARLATLLLPSEGKADNR